MLDSQGIKEILGPCISEYLFDRCRFKSLFPTLEWRHGFRIILRLAVNPLIHRKVGG